MNKVSGAVQLRFDIHASSLPEPLKARLLARKDQRISKDGVVVIKAQAHRSQEKNKADAWRRLQELVDEASVLPRVRRPTRPTRSSQQKRLERKSLHSRVKAMRGKIAE